MTPSGRGICVTWITATLGCIHNCVFRVFKGVADCHCHAMITRHVHTLTRFFLPRLAGILLMFAGSVAQADYHVYSASGRAAIDGFDVVSYFTKGAAEPGSPSHAVMWKGVIWQFSSNEHREIFEANPRAYAPQYGGYCAYGVAMGQVLETDPTVWRIQDGKLYLIHSQQVWPLWIEDVPGHISEANTNWPAVLKSK